MATIVLLNMSATHVALDRQTAAATHTSLEEIIGAVFEKIVLFSRPFFWRALNFAVGIIVLSGQRSTTDTASILIGIKFAHSFKRQIHYIHTYTGTDADLDISLLPQSKCFSFDAKAMFVTR
jgi:hypothetical protein